MTKTRISIIFTLCLFILGGCKTQPRPVVIENSHVAMSSDSLTRLMQRLTSSWQSQQSSERIVSRQTSTYTLNESGDTLKTVIEKESDRSRELRERELLLLAEIDSLRSVTQLKDSVYIEVPVPYEVIKETNILYWWQKTLMWTGAVAILALSIKTGFLIKNKIA